MGGAPAERTDVSNGLTADVPCLAMATMEDPVPVRTTRNAKQAARKRAPVSASPERAPRAPHDHVSGGGPAPGGLTAGPVTLGGEEALTELTSLAVIRKLA